MTCNLRLRVRTLEDRKTVAVLVSGVSMTAFEGLGEQLQRIASGHGASLTPRDLSESAQISTEFAGFDYAWLVENGPPEQLIAVIGEVLGFAPGDSSE
jgi:hypothetical protein